jgi:hypothetical protein
MPELTAVSYTGLQAYTLMPETNSTYLLDSHYRATAEPISGPTIGLMAILSTFQYQAPYMSPMYSNAASQFGKAAYSETGGQAMQDKATKLATKNATDVVHSMGITDGELGVVLGTAKVIRDRRLDLNGPKVLSIKTHLTLDQNSANLGLRWEFK